MAYHVYVVELSAQAAHRQGSLARLRHGARCYYVGSTHLPVRQRLSAHLSGRRVGSSIVARFGKRIVSTRIYSTREAAERAELALARRLAQSGAVVYTG